jgi:rhamnosyltransferase
MHDCCAVLVTYNPDLSVLKQALSAAALQVDKIYLVDNGSNVSSSTFFADQEKVEKISLPRNLGIAAGFNIGIRRAANDGYRYVLLLDQDSISPEGMVRRYVETHEQLKRAGVRVAATGPRYRDRRTGHTSKFVRYKWFRNAYAGSSKAPSMVAADFLISSGSFYQVSIFTEVGPFEERLFIDHVDTEWFHRAKSLGFHAFGLWDVILEHAIGERSIRLWIGRWRQQPIHKPFRLYYIVRNSLLIYRMPHVPWKWISSDIFRLARLASMYLLLSSQRRESLNWIQRGIRDGVQGTSGPLQAEFQGGK